MAFSNNTGYDAMNLGFYITSPPSLRLFWKTKRI